MKASGIRVLTCQADHREETGDSLYRENVFQAHKLYSSAICTRKLAWLGRLTR